MMSDPQSAVPGPTLSQDRPSELREYLAVVRARKWSIATITVVTVLAALFFSFRQTPIYESEAQVLVNPIPTAGVQTFLAPAPNLDTERTVASSLEVAELAADRLEDASDPAALLEGLSVEVATNSEVLVFRYADPRPLEAQRRVQAFSQAYLQFRSERALESLVEVQESIQQQIDEVSGELRRVNQRLGATQDEIERANLQTRVSQLSAQLAVLEQERSKTASVGELRVGDIIAQANLPASPASPNHVLNGALALLVGLALGVGFAFLRERLDDRLRGQSDLEARAGAPVLAVVPRVQGWKKSGETPLVSLTDPRSGPAEAYRTLRTGLLFASEERGIRTILITSPHPGEGKTATAANLAVVLAQTGRRVIVVSADLRKPRLHRFFGAKNEAGLSRLLTGENALREAVVDVGIEGIRLVPSGPVPKNPAELLGSHAMTKSLERFGEAADIVIIDGPPVLDVADTITLTPLVDAVVLVADAENTSRGAISHARKQLEQVRADVIGTVLNNLDPTKARPYYYRYYYRYGYEYGDGSPRGRRRQRSTRDEAADASSTPRDAFEGPSPWEEVRPMDVSPVEGPPTPLRPPTQERRPAGPPPRAEAPPPVFPELPAPPRRDEPPPPVFPEAPPPPRREAEGTSPAPTTSPSEAPPPALRADAELPVDPERDAPEGSPEDKVYQEIMRSFGGVGGLSRSWEQDLPEAGGGLWPGEPSEEDEPAPHPERGDPNDAP